MSKNLAVAAKEPTTLMSASEYDNSASDEWSDAASQGKPTLRKDEVAIIQEKLEQWMAADATKRKSIFKDIAHSIQRLDANKTVKSHQWVMKKKVSVSKFYQVFPYFEFL